MSCSYGLSQCSFLSLDLAICLRPVWCAASMLNCKEFSEFHHCKLCGVVRNNCLWKSMSGKYSSQTLDDVASSDAVKHTHLHPSWVIVSYDQQMLAWRERPTCINGNNLPWFLWQFSVCDWNRSGRCPIYLTCSAGPDKLFCIFINSRPPYLCTKVLFDFYNTQSMVPGCTRLHKLQQLCWIDFLKLRRVSSAAAISFYSQDVKAFRTACFATK